VLVLTLLKSPMILSWKQKDGKNFGLALRSGFRELSRDDFLTIVRAMKVDESKI
jgi:hypothetical protein